MTITYIGPEEALQCLRSVALIFFVSDAKIGREQIFTYKHSILESHP